MVDRRKDYEEEKRIFSRDNTPREKGKPVFTGFFVENRKERRERERAELREAREQYRREMRSSNRYFKG